MQVWKFLPYLHTRRSPTQSDIYQMLYWYNWFTWWWARVCSKHVENWNKHIEKNCASSWSFTRIIPRCTVSKIWTSVHTSMRTQLMYIIETNIKCCVGRQSVFTLRITPYVGLHKYNVGKIYVFLVNSRWKTHRYYEICYILMPVYRVASDFNVMC